MNPEVDSLRKKLAASCPSRTNRAMAVVCLAALLGCLALDLRYPAHAGICLAYGLVVLFSCFARNHLVTWWTGGIGLAFIVVGCFRLPAGDLGGQLLVQRLEWFAVVAALTPVVGHLVAAQRQREHLLSELESALEDVHMLQGILQICSCCKKIRTEEGSWMRLESYVMANSEARFSHGICDECAILLYGSYAQDPPGYRSETREQQAPADAASQTSPGDPTD